MQPWTIRFPDEVFDWIRTRAAELTIQEKRHVSMNAFVVDTFTRLMEEDLKRKKKKGGKAKT